MVDGVQSYQNPLPALSVVDETTQDWGKEVCSSEKKSIISDVCTTFVGEVLHESVRLDNIWEKS